MELVGSLLKNKVIEPIKNGGRKIYGWSYYGDLACKELGVIGRDRARVMKLFMLKGDGQAHGLWKLAGQLLKSPNYSKISSSEDKLRYYFGAVKRLY